MKELLHQFQVDHANATRIKYRGDWKVDRRMANDLLSFMEIDPLLDLVKEFFARNKKGNPVSFRSFYFSAKKEMASRANINIETNKYEEILQRHRESAKEKLD